MRRVVLALALSLATAAPSFAQQSEASPSADALANGLIDNADAEGVFEPLAGGGRMIAVRHIRSGLVCRMDPRSANRLVIFPRAARGEDVACDTTDGRETITLYATRFTIDASLDDQLAASVTAIRQRFPDARPYAATIEIPSDTLPPFRNAEFLATRDDGARMYTRVSIAMIGEWAVKLRYTALAPNDEAARQAELAASTTWSAVLAEIAPPPRP